MFLLQVVNVVLSLYPRNNSADFVLIFNKTKMKGWAT